MAAAPAPPLAIGQALLAFSVDGLFPEDDVSTTALRPDALPEAIRTLADAKTRLENDIHAIVEETADDVRSWTANAKMLQADIARRKTLATDITIRADAPETNAGQGAAEVEAEAKARFLTNELNYNLQVRFLLEAIQRINHLLDQVGQAARERRVLDALHLLEKSWMELDSLPASKSSRAIRLLDTRAFELKSSVHEVLDNVWSALVHVDVNSGTLTVLQTRDDEPMRLADAVIGLQAYKELDHRMADLWDQLDRAIVRPRTDVSSSSRPTLYVNESVLGLKGAADNSLEALFADLERMFAFLAAALPPELVQSASAIILPELVSRVVDTWLVPAVPTSLEETGALDAIILAVKKFCSHLAEMHYSGFGQLQEWVENAPRVWLSKRREVALGAVRQTVLRGLGTPHQVVKKETQMVSRSEVKELAARGPTAASDQATDWETAWSDEEGGKDGEPEATESPVETKADPSHPSPKADDDGADAWAAWGDEEISKYLETAPEDTGERKGEAPKTRENASQEDQEEDDAAAAWGWADEAESETHAAAATANMSEPSPAKRRLAAVTPKKEMATREMTLRENYHISSMPEPVLALIFSVLNDAAALTSPDSGNGNPVAAAAAGLFAIPSLVLAMFRATSPHYYALDVAGSMFLYNDAMYLAERLTDAINAAKTAAVDKSAVTAAPVLLAHLDADVVKLQAFANRAYRQEMVLQKTVLRDLLGSDQSVLQMAETAAAGGSDHGGGATDANDCVDAAVLRVRSMAAAWHDVLAPSAWYQAVGALADAVAVKLLGDVLEMSSISQDEAFRLANLIAKVVELDDMFLPRTGLQTDDNGSVPPLPLTAQYAPSWLRLQYLSEVLQANLREVLYLWMESELSLYFTASEVVELIRLSFEDNARAREVAREIAAHPHPMTG